METEVTGVKALALHAATNANLISRITYDHTRPEVMPEHKAKNIPQVPVVQTPPPPFFFCYSWWYRLGVEIEETMYHAEWA